MSGAPVNLRRARKARARAAGRAEADAAAMRHGRTKAERDSAAREKDRAVRHLEHHRLDRDDGGDP